MSQPQTSICRINVDSAEQIADTYVISPELATLIVEYRRAHGPYWGPDDLAQVEGISLAQANELKPLTDWTIPPTCDSAPEPIIDAHEKQIGRAWQILVYLSFFACILNFFLLSLHLRLQTISRQVLPTAYVDWQVQQKFLVLFPCLVLFFFIGLPLLVFGIVALYRLFRPLPGASLEFHPDWRLVKINSASAEDISQLPGIGMERAMVIVKWRNYHTWFMSPDSIARIETVGMELANRIAPYLDWSIPQIDKGWSTKDEPHPISQRLSTQMFIYILPALFFIVQFGLLENSLANFLPFLAAGWNSHPPPQNSLTLAAWILFDVGLWVGILGVFLTYVSGGFQPWRINRHFQIAVVCFTVTLIAWLVALVLEVWSHTFINQTLRFDELNRQALIAFAWWLVMVMYLFPYLLQLFIPHLRFAGAIQYFADFGIFCSALLTLIAALDNPRSNWMFAILGFFYLMVGIRAIFWGKSFYGPVEPSELAQSLLPNESEVITRYQREFPTDPEREIIFNYERQRPHPRRIPKILYWPVVVVGGFLVAQSAASVIQFFWDRMLQILFP